MIRLRNFLKRHGKAIASIMLLGCIAWPVAIWLTSPRPTTFLVQGQTTAFTFTADEQIESQSQAGLFAAPGTAVDLILLCSKLQRVDSSEINSSGSGLTETILPCSNGFLKLNHVFIESTRLGRDTRVDLLVDDKNLDLTLTPIGGNGSMVTLLFDLQSRIEGVHVPLEGEWTAATKDKALRLSFLRPHFHSADDEAGQRLSFGSAFAFQNLGRSAFLNGSGQLAVVEGGSEVRKPLNEDLLQVYSVQGGQVATLSPVTGSDGSLTALTVGVKGVSSDIQTLSTLLGKPANHAVNRAERLTGIHFSRATLIAILTSLVTGLSSLGFTILGNLHNKHISANTISPRQAEVPVATSGKPASKTRS